MARDKNNHYQETAAQLRQKIKQFVKRPAYVVPYLRDRNILSTTTLTEDNKWTAILEGKNMLLA